MTTNTTHKFSPEVRERAVRMVLDHEADHPSRWAAVTSIAEKRGCSADTLLEWVKKLKADSGDRAELADRLKAPERPDYRRYRDHNRVERMFGKLKQRRRIATRYDKTVLSSESFHNLAGAGLWLKTFVNAA
jgi:transposase-like protein